MSLNAQLCVINWRTVFNDCLTVNDYWSALYSTLTQLIHQYVSTRRQHGWLARARELLSHNVWRVILQKRKTWHRWRRAPSLEHKIAYGMASKNCSRLIQDYHAHEDLLVASLQQIFNHVSKRLKPHNNEISLRFGNKVLLYAQDVMNCLSKEFSKNF